MTAAERAALRELVESLPDDWAGHVAVDGDTALWSAPRDEHDWRQGTVMSWLEEDRGRRPTIQVMAFIEQCRHAVPALLDLVNTADRALARIHHNDTPSPDELDRQRRPGAFPALSDAQIIAADARRQLHGGAA